MAFWVGQFFVLWNYLAHCMNFGICSPSLFLCPGSHVLHHNNLKCLYLSISDWSLGDATQIGNCSKHREFKVRSLGKEGWSALLSGTLGIGTAFGNNLGNSEGELLHCGFPLLLAPTCLLPGGWCRVCKGDCLSRGPQPLVWVSEALQGPGFSFSLQLFCIGPSSAGASSHRSGGAGLVTVDQCNLEKHCHSWWGQPANQAGDKFSQCLNFHSAISVSES